MWVTLSLRKKELKQEHTYYQLRDLQISRQKRQLDRRKRYEQALIQNSQKQATNPIKQSYNEKIDELNKNKTALNEYLLAVKKIKDNSLGNYIIDEGNKVYMASEGGNYVRQLPSSSGDPAEFKNTKDLVCIDNKYYEKDDYESGLPELSLDLNSEGGYKTYQLAYDLSQYTEILTKMGFETDLSKVAEADGNISTLESNINSQISTIELEKQNAYTKYTGDIDAEKTIWENELEMLEEEVGEDETQLELEQTDVETQLEFISNELQAISDSVSQGIQQNTIKLS